MNSEFKKMSFRPKEQVKIFLETLKFKKKRNVSALCHLSYI